MYLLTRFLFLNSTKVKSTKVLFHNLNVTGWKVYARGGLPLNYLYSFSIHVLKLTNRKTQILFTSFTQCFIAPSRPVSHLNFSRDRLEPHEN